MCHPDVGTARERAVRVRRNRCAIGALGRAPRYLRPTEVDALIGDPKKAHQKLGWRHETSVRELAREMVAADLQVMRDAPIAKDS